MNRVPIEVPEQLSASGIARYTHCPFKYWANATDQPRRETDMSAMEFGSLVHEVMEKLYKQPQRPDDWRQMIEGEMRAGIDPTWNETVLNKVDKTIKNMIRYENHREKNGLKWPHSIEEHYVSEIPGRPDLPLLHGFIDYYDGETIIDWKTGSSRWFHLSEDKHIQGKVYEILVVPETTPMVEFIFISEGVVKQNPEEFTTERLIYLVEDMVNGIREGRFEPKPGKLCDWCEYHDICPHFNPPEIPFDNVEFMEDYTWE